MTRRSDENLLSRWSRRKRQAEDETIREDLEIDSQQQNDFKEEVNNSLNIDQASADEAQIPVLTDVDMPPLESLTEDSDYSGFMSSGVSDDLRNLALRKLFKAPSFNLRDGLDEYDEDYTFFEKLGDIVTCDMKHQIEMEAKKKAEKVAEKAKQAALNNTEDGPLDSDPVQLEETAAEQADDAVEENEMAQITSDDSGEAPAMAIDTGNKKQGIEIELNSPSTVKQ